MELLYLRSHSSPQNLTFTKKINDTMEEVSAEVLWTTGHIFLVEEMDAV